MTDLNLLKLLTRLNDAYKKIYGQFNNFPIVQSTFFFCDDINEVVDDVCTNEMVVKLV